MHELQSKILRLSANHDVSSMKLADLARLVNVSSLERVKHHRLQLMKKNLLSASENSKDIKINKEYLGKADLVSIPVLGSANAGPASIYADGKVSGYLRVSSTQLPIRVTNKLYALRVEGDSMNKAKIGPQKLSADTGDYIIADGQTYVPKTNDYVVSLIEGMANLKKLLIDRQREQVALVSESTGDYPPILIDVRDDMTYLAQSKVLHVVKSPQL